MDVGKEGMIGHDMVITMNIGVDNCTTEKMRSHGTSRCKFMASVSNYAFKVQITVPAFLAANLVKCFELKFIAVKWPQ